MVRSLPTSWSSELLILLIGVGFLLIGGSLLCMAVERSRRKAGKREGNQVVAVTMNVGAEGALTIDLGDGVFLECLPVGTGSFVMGSRGYDRSEQPRQEVEIAESFYAGKTPVTHAQFDRWTRSPEYDTWLAGEGKESGLAERHHHHFGADLPAEERSQLPAERVTWYEAEAYCDWLTRQLPQEVTVRLPREEEWEYVARAGSTTEYAKGDGEAVLQEMGWYSGNSEYRTHPVGRKAANGWGFHDCHGLVQEWTDTEWSEDAYREGRPLNGAAHPLRVVRGGSWNDAARVCRSAFRYWGDPLLRDANLGFRVWVVPGPAGLVQPGSGQGAEGRGPRERERGDES